MVRPIRGGGTSGQRRRRGSSAAADLQGGSVGAAELWRRPARRRRWRGSSAAADLQEGAWSRQIGDDLGVPPPPSPPSTKTPNAEIPWPLSYFHGEVTSHENLILHLKKHHT